MTNQDSKATFNKQLEQNTHLLVIDDQESKQTILLEDANYSLGRDPRNSIVINSKKVSRFHATFLKRSDARKKTFSYWILDGDLQGNRSTNGIFVNEKRCLVQELKNGDQIKLGYEVEATYIVVSNVSELMALKLEDLQQLKSKQTENIEQPKVSRESINKQTLVISEGNIEKEDSTNLELTKLASFPELSPNPIMELDWKGNITYLNPAAKSKFKELTLTSSPLDHPLVNGLLKSSKSHGSNNNLFVREVKIGEQIFEQYIHYLASKKLIRCYIFDFTKRKQLEAQLKESQQRYQAVINQTKEGIFLLDSTEEKIIEANAAFCDLLGYNIDEIYSVTLGEILPLDRLVLQTKLDEFVEQKNSVTELNFRHKNGSSLKLEASVNTVNYGDQKIFCFTLGPLTRNNSQITVIQNEQGLYDLVTGLPNRNLFMEQLLNAIANNKRSQGLLSLICLELEQTGSISPISYDLKTNLLEGFAKRLRTCLRSGDTVARWEDNQFAVLLPQVRSIKDVGKIAARIKDALQPPFFLEKQKIYLRTSMGIVICEEDGTEAEILLKNAQKTLERSKEKSQNNFLFYNQQTQKTIERLLKLEKLLYHALERQEFLLYYQPQVNIKTKEITGIEALLRWQHPELGRISPQQFIPLAEETGLIIPIGEWVIDTACWQNKMWLQNGITPVPITVNISKQQFKQPNLVGLVKNIIEKTGLKPNLLELEITEKVVMEDSDVAVKILNQLNELGVCISLDDFGSGVSGVGLLKQFKFHTLKLDRAVVKNLESSDQDLAIVSALITLGKNFGLRVIAEGVENQVQLELLSNLGCEEIQGNLFTEPLSREDATNFLGNPSYTKL
jgi:diguanylate cyclase (GGDEF)-like protein/PAS domain S-box-containing protein